MWPSLYWNQVRTNGVAEMASNLLVYALEAWRKAVTVIYHHYPSSLRQKSKPLSIMTFTTRWKSEYAAILLHISTARCLSTNLINCFSFSPSKKAWEPPSQSFRYEMTGTDSQLSILSIRTSQKRIILTLKPVNLHILASAPRAFLQQPTVLSLAAIGTTTTRDTMRLP